MKYKKVIVSRRGGPEVLQVIEEDLRDPASGEARIKVLAAPVCFPDVQARYGQSPFKKSPIFWVMWGAMAPTSPKKSGTLHRM